MCGVDHDGEFFLLVVDDEIDALDHSDALELLVYLFAILHVVNFLELELQLSGIYLAYVGNLLDEVEESVAVAQHGGVERLVVGVAVFVHELAQWRLYHGER